MSYDTNGIEYFLIKNFNFVDGTVKNISVAYRSINPTSTRGAVLIPTCYTGKINETHNFTSGALKDYHVIIVGMLGGSESTSPSNDDDFPHNYSLRYQVSNETYSHSFPRAQQLLITTIIGLHKLSIHPHLSTLWHQESRSSNWLLHGRPTSLLLGCHARYWSIPICQTRRYNMWQRENLWPQLCISRRANIRFDRQPRLRPRPVQSQRRETSPRIASIFQSLRGMGS